MAESPVEQLIRQIARLPGLGPRSARRIVLYLLQRRESVFQPLVAALRAVESNVRQCSTCRNWDVSDPCSVCTDIRRDQSMICVVEGVADLWALERSGAYKGQYHVLGGALSALEGTRPEDLGIAQLVSRASQPTVTEIVLAMGATVDGQTTAHYLADSLAHCGINITRLAHGVPVGGQLDYLDDGTLTAALRSRRPF
jgi:recombination protein RecR